MKTAKDYDIISIQFGPSPSAKFKLSVNNDCFLFDNNLMDLTYEERCELRSHFEDIVNIYETKIYKNENEKRNKENKQGIIDSFYGTFNIKEIPNEYAPNIPFFKTINWYEVETKIGTFKIGPRKRVIHIEWTDTIINETAKELFPEENVTKYDQVIHAWSAKDMKKYISRIIQTYEKKFG